MINKKIKVVLILGLVFGFQILSSPQAISQNALSPPVEKFYPNPYQLAFEDKVTSYEGKGYEWFVYANRKDAPILDNTYKVVSRTKYLEKFKCVERKKNHLKVISTLTEKKRGWMDMRHLIMLSRPIKNHYGVLQKVFLKVNLSEVNNQSEGIDILRFRNGPGAEKEGYDFLVRADEINRVHTLFFYVYGIHFKDDKLNNYQKLDDFKNADFFLVGDQVAVNAEDIEKGSIRGWIPREAAVMWDTRQALEEEPVKEGERPEAHKFENRTDLLSYYQISDPKVRAERIAELTNQGKAEKDSGKGPPRLGQTLRYMVLRPSFKGMDTAYIGFSGGGSSSDQNKIKIIESSQDTLAKWQKGSEFVDLFFLIDGTQSMEDPIMAAGQVIQALVRDIQKESKIKLNIQAALYRDKSEGDAGYEAWNKDVDNELPIWLLKLKENKRIFSNEGDDYPEALFYGIENALDNWNFSHDFSMRILLILGDAGDRNSSGIRDIANSMKGKKVLPLSIHFNHALQDYDPRRIGAICGDNLRLNLFTSRNEFMNYSKSKERKAMCAYLEQLTELNGYFYGRTPDLISVPSLRSDKLGEELDKYVRDIVDQANKSIELIRKIRQGQLSLQEAADSESDSTSKLGMGLFKAQIEILRQSNPELAALISEKPELGFLRGHVAVKTIENLTITRPILLLSSGEVGRIFSRIQDIRHEHRDCNPDVQDTVLKEAMTTILGDLLQINTRGVTDEELRKWFEITIKGDHTYVGIPDIIDAMCKNPQLWGKFLNKLEKAEDFLGRLRTEYPEERKYLDIHGAPYFWIYPEEIFPSFK
jgi:hypothetical protein